MKREKGSYVLLIALDKDATIAVGKLGTFSFPSGYYLYVGSALGGLSSRISRHLREDRKTHWHIDYLLKHSRVIEVWYTLSEEHLECLWARVACAMPQAKVPVPGFGSSDCQCLSHLIYFPDKPTRVAFQAGLEQLNDRCNPLARLSLFDAR